MADRIDDLQGHKFIGEQLQRPAPVTRGRLAQSQCDELGLALAVELSSWAGMGGS